MAGFGVTPEDQILIHPNTTLLSLLPVLCLWPAAGRLDPPGVSTSAPF
jgi:hypothetical protein